MPQPSRALASPGYQLFMLILSAYAVIALAVQAASAPGSQVRSILEIADIGVCAVFFGDFWVSLYRAPNRWLYFRTWGWLDLLSSLPFVEPLRVSRLGRILRIVRVLRTLRASRILGELILKKRSENTFLAASLVAFGLVVLASIAILHFEVDPESNITNAEDALWWAFATITTVGYGDRFPVTPEGRLVASSLMAGGVGLFGTFSGFLAAWFLGSEAEDDGTRGELAALREEIRALRASMPPVNPQ